MVSEVQMYRVLAAVALMLSCSGVARAQMIIGKNVGGRTVMCMRSGLTSDLKDCGTRANWYTYVFVGSISSVTPIADHEKTIQVVPEEIFLGAPTTPLTVTTSQADCMRELRAGDRWLFYLRQVKGSPLVMDYYANDSAPAADAQLAIETLRRLKTIGDFAIVRGQVLDGPASDRKPLAGARVIARRTPDGIQFVATTDAEGKYEFQPLPSGPYTIAVDPMGPHQPDDSGVDASSGACWDLTLSRSSHARIGGRVTHADGLPVADLGVALIRTDGTGYLTTETDDDGYFVFDSQEPGEFVVGLNFPGRSDWFDGSGAGGNLKLPPASLFYPGVTNRSGAQVIQLTADEKLDNINFTLTAE
jgi:Carboxypeptidase regulatory-like domain